jgi:DNA-binding MarR family transcriptional regulator
MSRNLKKMVENGYIAQQQVQHDRRSIRVKLTDKGRALAERISEMHQRHFEMLKETAVTDSDLAEAISTLKRLERFWMHTSNIASAAPSFAA